ncbi:PREDICTED: transmembrane protein 105 [Galeopterus variegatus]|uniref:Transmembrane protein 105 n=1 Tax=Galeopterus variegatus TaxID=482537 RepID=A0ABM0QFC9_GALVR|nr:PREDICTED: transmembrane protein 105 [Galeopterus variegatus]
MSMSISTQPSTKPRKTSSVAREEETGRAFRPGNVTGPLIYLLTWSLFTSHAPAPPPRAGGHLPQGDPCPQLWGLALSVPERRLPSVRWGQCPIEGAATRREAAGLGSVHVRREVTQAGERLCGVRAVLVVPLSAPAIPTLRLVPGTSACPRAEESPLPTAGSGAAFACRLGPPPP